MGCDAFALDITNPSESWALTALEGLFNHAATTDLRLFFSLDTAYVLLLCYSQHRIGALSTPYQS